MRKQIISLLLGISILIPFQISCTSCRTVNEIVAEQKIKDVTRHCLIVGMEESKAFGKCAGSLVDAQRARDYIGKAETKWFLYNQSATKTNVIMKLKDIIKRAENDTANDKDSVAIFYYSGHGGQNNVYNPNESDNFDEFLCLYDRGLLDDDIWTCIGNSKCRVVCIFDCCHSGTMYRTVTMDKFKDIAFGEKEGGIVVISGCPDNTVSYGTANGGIMTTRLLTSKNKYLTYEGAFNTMKKSVLANSGTDQVPQFTVLGPDFSKKKIFLY